MKNNDETLLKRFDSYMKKIIKNKGIDCYRKINIQNNKFDYYEDMDQFASDSLKADMDLTYFVIRGEPIVIGDEFLYEALMSLSNYRLEILLLSYYLEYTDCEIAKFLGKPRRTINFNKNRGLDQLREYMEEKSK